MKWQNSIKAILTTLVISSSGALLADVSVSTGVVSFRKCVEQSQQGKAEQAAFDALKNQMAAVLQKTEKEMDDLSKKLQDSEFMDSLSPEAEADMKMKFDALNQEMSRYQNQYYQILNQANMKVMQVMSGQVGQAASNVAGAMKLMLVINEDACFFYDSSLDVTTQVVAEMDKSYTPTANALPAPQAPSATGGSQ